MKALNLLSPDNDGGSINEGVEVGRGTNPLKPDTEHDGLSDVDEIVTFITDPRDSDSHAMRIQMTAV